MRGPLAGVRVLDLTFFLAGPFAGHMLADLGAEVIKVEPPTGDPSRRGEGFRPGEMPQTQFLAIQRGKLGLTVDLKNTAGRDLFDELVAWADILLENYRPGVTKRLGIDYDVLRHVNPGLVYTSITGFGSSGPSAQKPAFDYTMQAMAGTMVLTGGQDSPALMGLFMGDLGASVAAVPATLAALHERQSTGVGCHVDISMLESLLYLAPNQTQHYFLSGSDFSEQFSRMQSNGINRVVVAGDGTRLQVHCPFPKFQESLRELAGSMAGCQELLNDARFGTPERRSKHIDEYWELIDRAFVQRTRAEWLEALELHDIPCAPVNTVAEAVETPQLRFRGAVGQVAIDGRDPVRTFGTPFKFSSVSEPPQADEPMFSSAPTVGADNDRVLVDRLGKSEAEVAALLASGALGMAEPRSGPA